MIESFGQSISLISVQAGHIFGAHNVCGQLAAVRKADLTLRPFCIGHKRSEMVAFTGLSSSEPRLTIRRQPQGDQTYVNVTIDP